MVAGARAAVAAASESALLRVYVCADTDTSAAHGPILAKGTPGYAADTGCFHRVSCSCSAAPRKCEANVEIRGVYVWQSSIHSGNGSRELFFRKAARTLPDIY